MEASSTNNLRKVCPQCHHSSCQKELFVHAALPFYLNNILEMTGNILHVVKYNIPCKSTEGLSVSSYNH